MEIYHAVNRGVEGRDIFMDSQDYGRFVHELYEFNDTKPADNLYRLFDPGMKDLRGLSFRRTRERLVDIHGWCLMRNHFHLLLSERVEGGITRFLMKVNVGYAKYFNARYQRLGTLFSGRTKKVRIERQAHFLYILHYIHLNPLDYLFGAEKWRERDAGTLLDFAAAAAHLRKYRWSSYLDYIGVRNFPSVLTTSLFSATPKAYARELNEHLAEAAFDATGLTLE